MKKLICSLFQDVWSVLALIFFFYILLYIFLVGFPEPEDDGWGCIGNEKGDYSEMSTVWKEY